MERIRHISVDGDIVAVKLPIAGHEDLGPARYIVVCPEEVRRSHTGVGRPMELPLPRKHDAALGVVPFTCHRIHVGNGGASWFFQSVPGKLRVFPLVSQRVRHSLETSSEQDYLIPLTVIPPMMYFWPMKKNINDGSATIMVPAIR